MHSQSTSLQQHFRHKYKQVFPYADKDRGALTYNNLTTMPSIVQIFFNTEEHQQT